MSSRPKNNNYWPDELKAPDALDRLDNLAKSIGRRLPRWAAQRLRAAAFDRVFDRLRSFDRRRGEFWPWCRMVLQTLAGDLFREEQRSRKKNLRLVERTMAQERVDITLAGSLLPGYLAHTRELNELVMCHIRPTPRKDDRALLLLDLRCELARKLTREVKRSEHLIPEGTLTSIIADRFPWTPSDEVLCIRPGWPSLHDLWRALLPRVEGEEPQRLQAGDVVEVINAFHPQAELGHWHSDIFRARHRLRKRVGEAVWDTLFSPLLPTRRQAKPAV